MGDYKGLEHLQDQTAETIADRKGIYSGIKVRIHGLAPHMAITKVKAHVNKYNLTDPEDIFRAEGNDAADRVAKSAAEDSLVKPSPAEAKDWALQTRFLKPYLQYIPRALEKLPSVAPSSGRASLKKRDTTQDGGLRRRTFQADVLGEWGARPAEGPTPPDSTAQPDLCGDAGATTGAEDARCASCGPVAPPRWTKRGPRQATNGAVEGGRGTVESVLRCLDQHTLPPLTAQAGPPTWPKPFLTPKDTTC